MFGRFLPLNNFLPDTVVDDVVAVSAFALPLLFRLDDLPGTQLIVDPVLLLLPLLLCFFDFQSFIFIILCDGARIRS